MGLGDVTVPNTTTPLSSTATHSVGEWCLKRSISNTPWSAPERLTSPHVEPLHTVPHDDSLGLDAEEQLKRRLGHVQHTH